MNNTVSFQGKFLISNTVKDKHGFKVQLPPHAMNKLVNGFSDKTTSSNFDLELVDINPITKLSYFRLKSKDEVLVSAHENVKSTDLGKLTVSYLVRVYKKLVLKNSYNKEFSTLQQQYMANNKIRTVIDSNYYSQAEVEYAEALKDLNKKYNRLFKNITVD